MRSLRAYWVMLVIAFSYLWAVWKRSSMRLEARRRYMDEIHARNAARLAAVISRLGGFYAKVGQLISVMATMLPEPYIKELERVQDSMPPVPFERMRPTLQEEWSPQQWEMVKEIEEKPLASASIGQVHRATLVDGTLIVVKIQYPDLAARMARDLRTVHNILRVVNLFVPELELLVVYEELRRLLDHEMDFCEEKENILRFLANFRDTDWISAPLPIDELSSSRVLALQYVEGIKVNNVTRLREEGIDPTEVARRLLDAYALQFFEHGYYHADPHPGNILVVPLPREEGPAEPAAQPVPALPPPRPFRLVFLDFGAATELSERMRKGMIEFIQAAVKKDTDRLVQALKRMGFIPRGADPRVYDRVVAYFHERFHENIGFEDLTLSKLRFDASKGLENMADLRAMNISLSDLGKSFRIPREWILLERTILLLLGLASQIAPHLDPMAELTPHFTRFAKRYGLDPSTLALEAARSVLVDLTALPSQLRKILSSLAMGTLQLNVSGTDRFLMLVYASVQEVFFGTVGWLSLMECLERRASGDDGATGFGMVALLSSYLFFRALVMAKNAALGR